jgi:hypothetical protein
MAQNAPFSQCCGWLPPEKKANRYFHLPLYRVRAGVAKHFIFSADSTVFCMEFWQFAEDVLPTGGTIFGGNMVKCSQNQ